MVGWQPVPLVGAEGELRAPGRLADELRDGRGGVLLTGHGFGTIPSHARLLCHHLAQVGRPWAAEAELGIARDPQLLRLARRGGCRALIIGPEPDPLPLGDAAAALRRIRRAGLLTVVHVAVGRTGDDAGVFGRAVRLFVRGRVAFPRLVADEAGGPSPEELRRGVEWARRALHTRRAILWRTGLTESTRLGALVANLRTRRELLAAPRVTATPAMRLARALARPIRIRERVPFVSTLTSAVQAGGDHVRAAWCRARAVRDETLAALVIRLDGAVDARAARKLVSRIRRAVAGTPDRIVIDLGGIERVSLTVLTRFLEEHASRLGELRGRLAFRNLRPALDGIRRNLRGMLPNAKLLESALDEAG